MSNFLNNFKKSIKNFIDNKALRILSLNLTHIKFGNIQKSAQFVNWINRDLVNDSSNFVEKFGLNNSFFVKNLNLTFKTDHFESLLKRWTVDYIFSLNVILYDSSHISLGSPKNISLEDNPINRFAVEKYIAKFDHEIRITWIPEENLFKRLVSIFVVLVLVILISLKKGIKIFGQRRNFKVMRESIWGLYGRGGYFFHDDFLVDGERLKRNELLLFSRDSIQICDDRLKAYNDVKKSGYAHFFLPSLRMGISTLLIRIFPSYLLTGGKILLSELRSSNFSFLLNIFWFFVNYAIPYEKIFSNFEIEAELGHNLFSATHIPEAIVCKNYGTNYYLMHWSDYSINCNKYNVSFLACDKYLLWGKAHIRGTEGSLSILQPTGYVFKRFINRIKNEKSKVLSQMGISVKGRIITFFDESFGDYILMTENHYLEFWKTALKIAETETRHTVLIKPKELIRYKELSDSLRNEFLNIKNRIEKVSNAYIIDDRKWSFIESIGISDIVVSQGMTSSSTIAIICGIEGLYLDQAKCDHPFSKLFKDKIVFDDPQKLINNIQEIINGKRSPLKEIPEDILRNYDEYPDDRGIDLFREILVSK